MLIKLDRRSPDPQLLRYQLYGTFLTLTVWMKNNCIRKQRK
jgi:hypothetical protein